MTIKDETAITLKRNDVPLECNIQRYDANTIWVLVNKTYTEPGTYTLTFPKGSLAACPIDFTEGPTNSKAITMMWTIKDGGVDSLGANAPKVSVAGGAIRIDGVGDATVNVYSLCGALLYRGTDTTIVMPRGIYIVKVADTTAKVIL